MCVCFRAGPICLPSWPPCLFVHKVALGTCAQPMPLSLNPRAPQNSLKTMIAFQLPHLHTEKLSPVRENALGYKNMFRKAS